MENLKTQWVDTSVENFMTLSSTTKATFDTPQGLVTSQLIQYYSNLLGLNTTYGCSPATYSPDIDFSDPYSLYQLYVEQVVPKIVFNNEDKNTPFFISNTQSLRYSLFKGPVTRNDIYTISPFNDTFVMYQSMPGNLLNQLITNIQNTSGILNSRNLSKRYCGMFYDETPNWYMTSPSVNPSLVYDVILATYDAQTIYPVIQLLFGNNQPFSKSVPYDTEYNGTGALQVYIEKFWPC